MNEYNYENIEHQTRRLLDAASKQIPIITTFASGLDAAPHVHLVETGNYSAFKEAVVEYLG